AGSAAFIPHPKIAVVRPLQVMSGNQLIGTAPAIGESELAGMRQLDVAFDISMIVITRRASGIPEQSYISRGAGRLGRQWNKVQKQAIGWRGPQHIVAQPLGGHVLLHEGEGSIPVALIHAEDEDPVANDGTADGAPELVEGQTGFVAQALVTRIEAVGLKVLE